MTEVKKINFEFDFARPVGKLANDLEGYVIKHDGEDYCIGYRITQVVGETVPLISKIYLQQRGSWRELKDSEIQSRLGLTVRKDGLRYYHSVGAVFQILMLGLQEELSKKQP